ncbi:TOMM precursor leader peptide-binding protein [Streptomyces kanamyceticus]|uniref:TOMM precursor leader peptide-binding protein n=1 Tax=Streptomyces kanamyceticus TaxID=1967 RepID=UPI0006E272B7|nr:TOMM precursor leader peptide-binding protein [Streptomyces kanamyceticus]
MSTDIDIDCDINCDIDLPEDALAGLARATDCDIAVGRGWQLAREQVRWRRSAAAGRGLISVRLYDDEVVIGPRWTPGTDSGCAGCAEVRERTSLEHPLVEFMAHPLARPGAAHPLLPELLTAAVAHLTELPLESGELYAVSGAGTRRHRVPRSFHCPVCALDRREPDDLWRPEPLALRPLPASPHDPTRGTEGARLVAPGALRRKLVDARYGPVQTIMRESAVPFAMSMALELDAPAMGHGRARTFAETEPVAIIEAYERLGGFPFEAPVLMDRSTEQVRAHALDPASFGTLTEEQLAHPSCKVRPFSASTAMDWVWGHDLDTGAPMLVPAEIGFFQYEYRYRLNRHRARADRAAGPSRFRKFFHDSSSGCAAGASLEEAALHSLLELAERDAFLLAWHRAAPLPSVDPDTLTDGESRALVDLIRARGFDVHVLVATQDIALPIVWVLVVNREHPFPATYSSGGSGADPNTAVRGALREVAQLVTNNAEWERADVEPMADDPWLLEELEHHLRLYTLPQNLDRATAALGGPRVTLADAFPGWPDTLRRAAGGHVKGALDHVRGLYAAAGLDRIVLVDQSTREHRDAGIAVAKAVVPGILPMCFGHAQQRLTNLPRLTAALAGTPQAGRQAPYDPHPFP